HIVGKRTIGRRTLHSSEEGLIHRRIPRRANQHGLGQFPVPSYRKADNRHAYGSMIWAQLRHRKYQLNFTLHTEQIGGMLSAKRRDRAVLPTLPITTPFSLTFLRGTPHHGPLRGWRNHTITALLLLRSLLSLLLILLGRFPYLDYTL